MEHRPDESSTEERSIDDVVKAALAREQDAERRDRLAEERDRQATPRADGADTDRALSAIDRTHAGRDRDAAAIDRAALIDFRRGEPLPDDEEEEKPLD